MVIDVHSPRLYFLARSGEGWWIDADMAAPKPRDGKPDREIGDALA